MQNRKIIQFKKFGTTLSGREEGRTTFGVLEREIGALDNNQVLNIDLTGVEILNLSYADESIVPLMEEYPKKIKVIGTMNLAVRKSLIALEEARNLKILPN